MATKPSVSYDRILHLAMVGGVALVIWAVMHALYMSAHSRGLPEPFQWVFAAAGFTLFILILPRLLKRGE